ncbi:11820_t:CDS:1, partial [Rhizophagus irregularis]
TMSEYAELMKRCWSNDPKKRPIAKNLKMIFNKYPNYSVKLINEYLAQNSLRNCAW